MANNELEFRTVSQCSTADWCRGYNEAVKEANEIIKHQQDYIDALRWTNKTLLKEEKEKRRALWKKAVCGFAAKVKESASPGWDKSIEKIADEMLNEHILDNSLDTIIKSCETMSKNGETRTEKGSMDKER